MKRSSSGLKMMPEPLSEKILFGLGAALYLSDLLFPLWLLGIMIFLMKRNWRIWQSWLVASAFCLTQAYLVAKYIGYNIGAYVLIWSGFRFFTIIHPLPPGTSVSEYFTPLQADLLFWLAPAVAIIILPAMVLRGMAKVTEKIIDSRRRNK